MRWIAILISTLPMLASAELYRWTDDNGKVHFSDQPRGGDGMEQMEEPTPTKLGQGESIRQINERLDRLRTSEAERTAKEQKEQQKLQAKRDKLNAQCDRERKRLDRFRNYRMYRLDNNGERVYYNKEEVAEKISEISEWISKNCSG